MARDLFIVTGAGGWLGKRVVRALTQGDPAMNEVGGHTVRALLMPGEDAGAAKAMGAEVVTGDLRAPATALELLRGAEGATVLHLAGMIHPRKGTQEFLDVNVGGTKAIVMAAQNAGVRRVVDMSSNSPIGVSKNPHEIFDEESPYNPYMGYGRSKRIAEEWLRAAMGIPGMPEITIIRAPWFYGPDQPARQSRFFTMIKQGKFPVMGKGENRRSMAYVDNLTHGILLSAAAPVAANRIYWIADERPYPMHEIIDTVRAILRDEFAMAVKPTTVHVPGLVSDIARLADAGLQAAGLYNQEIHVLSEMNLTIACSIARAKRELGYSPLVELREGMRRSVQWCLDQGTAI